MVEHIGYIKPSLCAWGFFPSLLLLQNVGRPACKCGGAGCTCYSWVHCKESSFLLSREKKCHIFSERWRYNPHILAGCQHTLSHFLTAKSSWLSSSLHWVMCELHSLNIYADFNIALYNWEKLCFRFNRETQNQDSNTLKVLFLRKNISCCHIVSLMCCQKGGDGYFISLLCLKAEGLKSNTQHWIRIFDL